MSEESQEKKPETLADRVDLLEARISKIESLIPPDVLNGERDPGISQEQAPVNLAPVTEPVNPAPAPPLEPAPV